MADIMPVQETLDKSLNLLYSVRTLYKGIQMKTEYKTFSLLVRIEGEVKRFEFPAISLEAALADIRSAVFGDVELVQWGSR